MSLFPSGASDSARKTKRYDFGSTASSSATERARTRLNDYLHSNAGDGGLRRIGEPIPKAAKTDEFEMRQLKAKVRELEANHLNQRAQTLKAQQELDQLRLELERERMERDNDRKARERDVEEHAEAVADLERQRRFLLTREETLSTQLKEMEEQVTKLRKTTSDRVRQVEQDKVDLEHKLKQAQEASLNTTRGHYELELQRAQQSAATWQEHGESLEKELAETQRRAHRAEDKLDNLQFDVDEVERLRQTLATRTQQLKDLQAELGSPQQLQAAEARRLRRLEAENKHFKQTIENEALTKEKLVQCQAQLKLVREQLVKEQQQHIQSSLGGAAVDDGRWSKLLSHLGVSATASGLTSADDAIRYVSQLQQELAVLRHTHHAVAQDAKHLTRQCADHKLRIEDQSAKIAALETQLAESQREEQRLTNRVTFLKKELDCATSFGASYQEQAKRFAGEADPVLQAQVKDLEGQLARMHARNEALEAEMQTLSVGGASDVTSSRYMDYDPATTKVVGLKITPLTMHKQAQARLVQTLRAENQALLARVGQSSGQAPSADSSGLPSARESELQTELETVNKRMQRLKEVFQKNVQDFRAACYELTGFKIEASTVDGGTRYHLHSMYAERPTDVLLFQNTPKGMQLLESDFARQWQAELQHYLGKMNSIPGFLSAVTQELLSRTTVMK